MQGYRAALQATRRDMQNFKASLQASNRKKHTRPENTSSINGKAFS